jgi:hypothetical protein
MASVRCKCGTSSRARTGRESKWNHRFKSDRPVSKLPVARRTRGDNGSHILRRCSASADWTALASFRSQRVSLGWYPEIAKLSPRENRWSPWSADSCQLHVACATTTGGTKLTKNSRQMKDDAASGKARADPGFQMEPDAGPARQGTLGVCFHSCPWN